MNKYYAECIGVFALVFCGCGAIVVNSIHPGTLGHVGISLVFGLIVMVMIYSVGNISGAHLNPAVTWGFFFAGRLPFKEVPPYCVAQILGALAGGFALALIFPEQPNLGVTLPSGPVWQTLLVECLLSFLLMFVILNVSTGHMEKGIMAGVAVGGTIALEALMGGPISGASMNPARSLGPAIASGMYSHLWIYIVAPCIGTVIASPLCRLIQGEDCCTSNGTKGMTNPT